MRTVSSVTLDEPRPLCLAHCHDGARTVTHVHVSQQHEGRWSISIVGTEQVEELLNLAKRPEEKFARIMVFLRREFGTHMDSEAYNIHRNKLVFLQVAEDVVQYSFISVPSDFGSLLV